MTGSHSIAGSCGSSRHVAISFSRPIGCRRFPKDSHGLVLRIAKFLTHASRTGRPMVVFRRCGRYANSAAEDCDCFVMERQAMKRGREDMGMTSLLEAGEEKSDLQEVGLEVVGEEEEAAEGEGEAEGAGRGGDGAGR